MIGSNLTEVRDDNGQIIGHYKQDNEMIYVFRPNGDALTPTQKSSNPEHLAKIMLKERKQG